MDGRSLDLVRGMLGRAPRKVSGTMRPSGLGLGPSQRQLHVGWDHGRGGGVKGDGAVPESGSAELWRIGMELQGVESRAWAAIVLGRSLRGLPPFEAALACQASLGGEWGGWVELVELVLITKLQWVALRASRPLCCPVTPRTPANTAVTSRSPHTPHTPHTPPLTSSPLYPPSPPPQLVDERKVSDFPHVVPSESVAPEIVALVDALMGVGVRDVPQVNGVYLVLLHLVLSVSTEHQWIHGCMVV